MPVVPSLGNAEYHRLKSISSGGLRRILKSPAHFKAWKAAPPAPTPAMRLGTAIHTAIMEPDKWGQVVAVLPADVPDRRSTAGRAWHEQFEAEAGGRIILRAEQAIQVFRIRDTVMATPASSLFESGGQVEETLLWRCTVPMPSGRRYATPCRARPDFSTLDRSVIIDLKSSADASREAFMRSIWSYRYDMQAAWYLDGMMAATDVMPHSYLWCVAESEEPYAVAWYRAEQSLLDTARADIDRALRIYARCQSSGEWPGYPDIIQPIELPRWARAQVEPEDEE